MCVCFYFFFFKQKTAYEMRISDWSSDVCSSDLRDHAFEHVDREHAERKCLALRAQCIGGADVAAADRAQIDAAAQPPDQLPAHQIAEQISEQRLDDQIDHARGSSDDMCRIMPQARLCAASR